MLRIYSSIIFVAHLRGLRARILQCLCKVKKANENIESGGGEGGSMGTCQNCRKQNVVTQPMEVAGSSLQVCAECCSRIQENRAKYARRKTEAEERERKARGE